jgi:predicted secreted protein
MDWFTGIVVYLLIWWVALFSVLPWGNRPAEHITPGTVESAPAKPRLLLKFLATSLLAGVIWGVIFWLVKSDLISFREMAKKMPLQ